MIIEGAAFLESELELHNGVRWWDAAACYGPDGGHPVIGAEEGGAYVGVLEVEDRAGEGLQCGGGGGGEVDYLEVERQRSSL
jgi:hypothetical protein